MNWRRRSLWMLFACLLVGLVVARVLCFQGVLAPIRIASGSMVPALRGAHYAVVCDDCKFPFPCDATNIPETGKAVCPNCGFPGNQLALQQLRIGQRVVIDRFPSLIRLPRRWELVAYHDPLKPEEKAVKRVVGLPGECVSIRHGELFIDGRIARKPITVQRATSVLVHDDRFRPSRSQNLPPRWDSTRERDLSGWQQRAQGYQFLQRPANHEIDWLTYRNWRCFASPLPRSAETPMLDHYGFNQNTSRSLHAVSDVSMSCRVHMSMAGELWLRVRDARDTFEARLDRLRQSVTLRHNGVATGSYRCPLTAAASYEFGICDRQVFLTVNRRLAFRETFEPGQESGQPTSSPLAIGGRQSELRIEDLQVYRDVYYLDPNQLGGDWSMRTQTSQREILVLGDNVPISRDSRGWPSAGLSHKSLIGRVLAPF